MEVTPTIHVQETVVLKQAKASSKGGSSTPAFTNGI